MAKKTITLDCDFKKTNLHLRDCIEALNIYGVHGLNEVDLYNLNKLAKTVAEFTETYETEAMDIDEEVIDEEL